MRCASTSVSSRLTVNTLQTFRKISQTGRSQSFLSLLRDCCSSLQVASSSLRYNTESEDELDASLFPETRVPMVPNDSCGSVVEDELLPDLTDKGHHDIQERRGTTWWQSPHARNNERRSRKPHKMHKWEWHNRGNVWDKMATCWAGRGRLDVFEKEAKLA